MAELNLCLDTRPALIIKMLRLSHVVKAEEEEVDEEVAERLQETKPEPKCRTGKERFMERYGINYQLRMNRGFYPKR